MSRPFSYNDVNFTVIGNLLIVHVPYNGALNTNDIICDVPPEIANVLNILVLLDLIVGHHLVLWVIFNYL